MMEIKRVNEVFPNWLENGIFGVLNTFDVPWKDTVNPIELDIAYHGGHSGNKIISPLVDNLVAGGELSDASRTLLASSMLAVYGRNWGKLWDTLSFDYNPIENYSMIETEEITGQSTSNTTLEETENNDVVNTINSNSNATDTGTINKSTDNETTSTNNNANNVYGFNSSEPVGADNQIGTTTAHTDALDTETRNLTATNETNETGSVETTRQADTITTNSGTTTNNKTLTRSGNIGVTTSQQMIESERELWNWYFFDVIFRDIDKMLTLSIY